MLVITRKVEQSVRIGNATVTVLGVTRGRVKLGIEAADDVKILRTELMDGRYRRPYKSKTT